MAVSLTGGDTKPAKAASVTVFDTDFNLGAPPEFAGVTTTEAVQGFADLGTGSNVFGGNLLRNQSGDNYGGGPPPEKTTLTLTGLPPHTSIRLGFLLAIIDSWDGDGCLQGPDRFNVTVDGLIVFSEAFENGGCGLQTYVPPVGVGLARHVDLAFTPAGPNNYYLDSAYNMGLDPAFNKIPHTADMLTIEWFASGGKWQGSADESWALDNVQVSVVSIDPPPVDEHDANLTVRANAIEATLAQIQGMVDALNLANLDMRISSLASQLKVDALSSTVDHIDIQLMALDLSRLDASLSSRASPASVAALSNPMAGVQTSVNDLNARMVSLEQSLNTLQTTVGSCKVKIALTAQGTTKGNTISLEFYLHTTQASQRVDPESVLITIGSAQVNLANITAQPVIPGVTRLALTGYKANDLKNQPLIVEAVIAGHTCSDKIVIP